MESCEVRAIAADRSTSLNAMIREFLLELSERESKGVQARKRIVELCRVSQAEVHHPAALSHLGVLQPTLVASQLYSGRIHLRSFGDGRHVMDDNETITDHRSTDGDLVSRGQEDSPF